MTPAASSMFPKLAEEHHQEARSAMMTIRFKEMWHDIGVELSLGIFLLVMVVGIVLTFLMSR